MFKENGFLSKKFLMMIQKNFLSFIFSLIIYSNTISSQISELPKLGWIRRNLQYYRKTPDSLDYWDEVLNGNIINRFVEINSSADCIVLNSTSVNNLYVELNNQSAKSGLSSDKIGNDFSVGSWVDGKT